MRGKEENKITENIKRYDVVTLRTERRGKLNLNEKNILKKN